MSRPEPAGAGPERLRDRLRRLRAIGSRTPGPAAAPGTGWTPAPAGEGFEVVRARFALSHRHGQTALGDSLRALAAGGAGEELSGTFWLDTETTGLAGGTGTYVFLVGLGFFDGAAFSVEQFLLRRLSAEGRFLSALLDRLAGARRLVTFNGRRFDWPLLETRFILAQLRPQPIDLHTDLIYPARRLWHRVLGTHRLTHLEAEVLGAPRPGDIPGWMIPQVYIQYLRTADRTALESVLAHNRADLLALFSLHAHVARVLRDPTGAGGIDWEGAGVLLARGREHRQAAVCFEEALRTTLAPRDRWRTLRRCVQQYRALGEDGRIRERWEQEARIWRQLDRYRVQILSEVARGRERAGDRAGARGAAEEALRVARWLRDVNTPRLHDLVARLTRRVTRLAPAAADPKD